MSTQDIEELRQLAQAATTGIWCHVQRGISRWHGERIEADLNPICDFAMLQDCCVHEYDRAYENAAYIQAANPAAIIGLIDTIQAQAERVKALELDLDVQAGSIEAVQAVNTRQAERIKELEGQLDDATAAARTEQMIAETAQAAASRLLTERDELRAQLAALEADYAETRDELQEANDSLASTYHILGERDAQLAAIAATEPVSHQFQTVGGGWHPFLDDKHYQNTKDDGRWPIRELFTRPMSADVTELVELLEFMWRDVPMNEYAFEKLEAALSKYKGAK